MVAHAASHGSLTHSEDTGALRRPPLDSVTVRKYTTPLAQLILLCWLQPQITGIISIQTWDLMAPMIRSQEFPLSNVHTFA